MGRLQDKTALITGAARGIGRAIGEAFAREGADVFLVTRTTPLDESRAACAAHGVRVEGTAADVADPDAARRAVEACVAAFGRIDILVNNAGITRDGLLVRMKDEDFNDVIQTNLTGAFNCMRAVAKGMMKQRWGRIINISSVVGQTGNPGQTNYAASKAGMIGMTKAVARELASRSITVNAIAPGYIETGMTADVSEEAKERLIQSIPLGRFGLGGDVAAAAVYLASEEAGYVTGQTLSVNGGMAM